ncbi:metalloprotease [Coemansia sp. RSA 2598]|nr:metalloprotease [Coemansia sp. RSA 2598]
MQGNYALQCINICDEWEQDAISGETGKITFSQFKSFSADVFNASYIKLLFVGDFEESDVVEGYEKIMQTTNSLSIPLIQRMDPQVHCIDAGYYIHTITDTNLKGKNNAVISYIYCGSVDSAQETALSLILAKMMAPEYLYYLRTVEQLGYVVSCNQKQYSVGQNIISFRVEGECNPMYMAMRINNFIAKFGQALPSYDENKLTSLVKAVVNSLKESPLSISGECDSYWKHIKNNSYGFDRSNRLVAALNTLTRSDLVSFFNKYLNPKTSPRYTRMESHVWSANACYAPSFSQIAEYPESVIALHGCLYRDGATDLTIDDVNHIVSSAVCNCNSLKKAAGSLADVLVNRVQNKGVQDKISKDGSQSQAALHMAIAQKVDSFCYSIPDGRNFSNIGMKQNPNGIWLIADAHRFKQTQPMYGHPIPERQFSPKY